MAQPGPASPWPPGRWRRIRLGRQQRGHHKTQEGRTNQEQSTASWDQLKGALKTQWGKITDEDLLQIAGDLDKFKGTIQKRYGELKKEEVRKWANRWYARWSGQYEGYEEATPIS